MRHVTPILIIPLALVALLTGCATPTGGDSAGTGPTQASDATSESGSLDGELRTRYADGAGAALLHGLGLPERTRLELGLANLVR